MGFPYHPSLPHATAVLTHHALRLHVVQEVGPQLGQAQALPLALPRQLQPRHLLPPHSLRLHQLAQPGVHLHVVAVKPCVGRQGREG